MPAPRIFRNLPPSVRSVLTFGLALFFVVAPGTASAQSDPGDASLTVARMTTNGRVNPLGIAGTDISFG